MSLVLSPTRHLPHGDSQVPSSTSSVSPPPIVPSRPTDLSKVTLGGDSELVVRRKIYLAAAFADRPGRGQPEDQDGRRVA